MFQELLLHAPMYLCVITFVTEFSSSQTLPENARNNAPSKPELPPI